MVDKLKLTNRLMNVRDKSKVFHTSGYAASQNGANFGAASTESFAERRSVDENRKFVRGYNNSRILSSAYGVERARKYVPRTGKIEGSSAARQMAVGANTGGSIQPAAPASLASSPRPIAPPTRRSAGVRLK
ncbi:hypothetical protein IJJ18_02195 [Candidatus Saccharibacteria bacterium]|nr:hypothetical protein [Candidatus Saccharibacteria bacterium]